VGAGGIEPPTFCL